MKTKYRYQERVAYQILGLSKCLRKEKGQSMVEFALVLFILIFFSIVVIEIGGTLFNYMNMGVSANAGAFQASLGKDEATVEAVVREALAGKILSLNGGADIDFGMHCTSLCTYGETVTVALTKTERFPLLGVQVDLRVSSSVLVQKE